MVIELPAALVCVMRKGNDMANDKMKVTMMEKPVQTYGKYSLYEMRAEYDLNVAGDVLSEFTKLKEEYKDDWNGVEKAANYAVQKVLDIQSQVNTNSHIFGCTAFAVKEKANHDNVYMGRNYDFAIDTSCICVRCEPRHNMSGEQAYRSVAFAAVSNLKNVTDPTKCSDETLMMLPFICLDGINEKGVSIAVLVVDTKDDVGVTRQFEKEWNVFTTLAIRIVLDFAASTEEAVCQLSKLNMFAVGGKDYHFFISDASGDSRVVEYDYRKKETRDFVAVPTNIATNFYLCDENTKCDEEPHVYFGHGHNRYIAVQRTLDRLTEGDNAKATFWSALKHSSQEYKADDPTSNTQWSILFDNTNKSAEIAIRRHFDENERITFYVPNET